MNNLNIVLEAVAFASTAHAGVLRGGRGVPYINHPISVIQRLHRRGFSNPDTLVAAALHDVVEDTAVKIEAIEDRFGPRPAEIVGWVTLPEDARRDREKKQAYQIRMMGVMDVEGVALKIGDKTDNVYDLYADPPKWGIRAIRGYADASREVVLAGIRFESDPRIAGLIADFESAYQTAISHYASR